jgi:ubiquinone/menaquinone biosynthesis C-methylase UbiE
MMIREAMRSIAQKAPLLGKIVRFVRRAAGSRMARGLENRFHISESRWRRRGEEDARRYWENAYLADAIRGHSPRSALEVGCNCGNILLQLSHLHPGLALTGIDLNRTAIRKGREWLSQAGATGITLIEGSAEELEHKASGPFDIVFSLASLIYVPPASIVQVLSAMIRASRKAVILMEMQADRFLRDEHVFGEFCRVKGLCQGNWKRDYPAIIEGLGLPVASVTVTWVPREVWQPGGGGAALIEVRR